MAMKLLLLAFAILQAVSISASCPTECYCFGFNGEWFADCARRGLSSVTYSQFDTKTTEIHMQYNNIETLPADAFDNVPNLKHLYLQSNKIAELPVGIFNNLPELETLRINSNRIADIGINRFSNLKKLQLLYIHDNDLKQVSAAALTDLEKLEQVSVAGNPNLADIATNAFNNLENLTMIDMSGSALTNINPVMVNRNPNLEKVYTYNIDTLDCATIQPYLTYMLLNPLTAFGRASMICAEPEYLRGRSVVAVDPEKHIVDAGSCPDECDCFGSDTSFIADCSSRGLTAIPIGFAPETTEIFLQNNQLTSLLDNNFLHLVKLEYLYLHDNHITTLGLNAFTGPAQTLKQLTLNDNRLGGLTAGVFSGMRSLEVLNLNNNGISILRPREFSDMVALVQFSMNNNSLRVLPEATFSSLVSLKYLGLAQNNVESVPETVLDYSPDLYFVDFSDNDFMFLPKIPTSVSRFEARNSRILSLTPSNFAEARNLAVLDLAGNKIYVIEKDAFDGAKSLQYIYLTDNHMEAITDETFASASELIFLDLTGNTKLTTISDNAFYGQRFDLQQLELDSCGFTFMNGKALSMMEHPNFYELASFLEVNSGKVDEPTCREPKERQGQMITEVSYEEACTIEVPQDDDLALVMSLSIVGAVVIFAAVAGVILYKSNQSAKHVKAKGVEVAKTNGGNDEAYKNTAYSDDETTGQTAQL